MKKYYLFISLISLALFFSCTSKTEVKIEEKAFTVKKSTLQRFIETNGSVQIQDEIRVSAPVSGRLDKLFVEEGQNITKGQKLAIMSSNQRVQMLDMAAHQGTKEVRFWEKQILPSYVYAPSAGKIIEIKAKPGESLKGHFITLSQGHMVKANLDEVDLPKVRKGQKINVQFDIASKVNVEGTIDRISQISRKLNNVNVYAIEILLQNTQSLEKKKFTPRIGMSVTLSIPVKTVKNALYLPLEAVQGKSNKHVSVQISGKEEKTKVKLGSTYQDNVHIISGLNEGDEIIVLSQLGGFEKKRKKSPLNFFKK